MHLDPHTLVETVSFLLVTVSIRLATPRKLQGFSRLSLQSLCRYNEVTDVYYHAWLFDMTAEDSNLRSSAYTRSALSKAELSPKPGVNFISYFFSNASATYVYIHAYIGVNPYLLFCISREKKKGHCGSGGGGALWSLSDRHYNPSIFTLTVCLKFSPIKSWREDSCIAPGNAIFLSLLP